MWQANVGRRQFSVVLQRDTPGASVRAQESGEQDGLQNGDIGLLWARQPRAGELPVALILREEEIEDFFAWTNTYVPNWSPISAYFRVFSDSESIGSDWQGSYEGEKLLEAASIGLIVAEAMGQLSEGYDVNRVSMSACVATFSYAACQGIRHNVEIVQLARKWSICRSITGQGKLRIKVENVVAPWEAVLNVVNSRDQASGGRPNRGKKRLLVDGLTEVVNAGEIAEETWKRLTAGFPNAQRALEAMRGTQEERVLVLESVLGERANRRFQHREEHSFVAGYLGSRIFPGTIRHAGLVSRYVDRYPSALLWLGLFAGLHEKRELNLSRLGRQVWRAIEGDEPVLSRPRCDIDIRELGVLVEAGMFGAQYRTATPGRLIVELHPCVNTVVRWPAQAIGPGAGTQGELFVGTSSEMARVIGDLKDVRRRLDGTIRKLDRWNHRQK